MQGVTTIDIGRLSGDGYQILENAIEPQILSAIASQLDALQLAPRTGGIRQIEQKLPSVLALIQSSTLMTIAQAGVRGIPRLVRAIAFDKTPDNSGCGWCACV